MNEKEEKNQAVPSSESQKTDSLKAEFTPTRGQCPDCGRDDGEHGAICQNKLAIEIRRRKNAVVEAAVEWHQSGREGDDSWFDKAEILGTAIDRLLELRQPPQPRSRIVQPAASFQPPDSCPECKDGVPFDAEGRHVHTTSKRG